MALLSYVMCSYRYWMKLPSYGQLKNWLKLTDSDVAAILENDGHDGGIITVSCGGLKCKFGVKTYQCAGYVESFV